MWVLQAHYGKVSGSMLKNAKNSDFSMQNKYILLFAAVIVNTGWTYVSCWMWILSGYNGLKDLLLYGKILAFCENPVKLDASWGLCAVSVRSAWKGTIWHNIENNKEKTVKKIKLE